MQLKISHEKYMEEATSRVSALEAEIEALQQQRAIQSHATLETINAPSNDNERPSHWRWLWLKK
jgi:hypothetical protein